MSKKPVLIETEILKIENVLIELDVELIAEQPSYSKLKALSKEVLARAKRIRKAVRRDKQYFKT